MQEVSCTHLKKNLYKTLSMAEEGPVIITHRAKPKVVMISYKLFEKIAEIVKKHGLDDDYSKELTKLI